ncbi:MAG: signal recognition particle-docking protein FtsY [Ruminococcus sp.]|nr:signal recognition particle-docking protein FtsY [Ruminococcus sp.]
MGIIQKIAEGLRKTKDFFLGRLQKILNSFTVIDDELFEELEEAMIMSDIGVETSEEICDRLRKKIKERGITDPKMIMELIQEIIGEIMGDDTGLDLSVSPSVIMVIGVNGAGKTTTIGKMCHQFRKEKKKVLVAAADTFRAAAIDQLEVWTERAGVDIVKHAEGSDPGAVVYDALDAAKARGCDIVIIDTAGRLHNKKNLMEELAKINRIIDKKAPDSSRETLLVLDATTGQNAVNQAKLFGETANITGIVLTKLDGTAKGGIVISIKNELGIPVKLIGVGEKIDDLQSFDSRSFVAALFSDTDIEQEEEKAEETEENEIDEETEDVEDDVAETEEVDEPKKQGLFSKIFGSKETETEDSEITEEEETEVAEGDNETEESEETEVVEEDEETEEKFEELKALEEEKENRKQRFFSKFAIAEEETTETEEEQEETEEETAVETFDEYYEPDEEDEDDDDDEEYDESDEEDEDDEEENIIEETEEPKTKKRGFFSRLFGRKDKDDD